MATDVVSTAIAADKSGMLSKAPIVAATWMASSALFTTYSTTKFLRYEDSKSDHDHPAVPIKHRRVQIPAFVRAAIRPSAASKDALKTTPPPSALPRLPAAIRTVARPMLLTYFRFGGSLILGLLAHPNFNIMERIRTTLRFSWAFTLPAIFLFIANYTNSISLQRVGISLTYTSKCGIPLVTVLLTLMYEGPEALPATAALLSLIPIALGIAAASWNSPTFEKWGFVSALISCVAQSGVNLSTKYAMTRLGATGIEAQRSMVLVGFGIVSTICAYHLVSTLLKNSENELAKNDLPPSWLGGAATLAYHLEYVLSFTFVKLVSPITYGACDAVRRLLIIVMGNFMFAADSFTLINVVGISTALLGALGYSTFNVPKVAST